MPDTEQQRDSDGSDEDESEVARLISSTASSSGGSGTSRQAAAAAEPATDEEGPAPRSRADIVALLAFAVPLALTRGSQGVMQQTNVMFVGHLGTVELGAGASGNLWAGITGRSILIGGLSSLDSLASQAYGAKEYAHIGTLTQRAALIVTLLCIPIGLSWVFLTGPVLALLNFPLEQAALAQTYTRILVVGLWPDAMTQVMQSFLQVQGLTRVPMVVTGIAAVLNIGLNYYLVYGENGYGFIGSPICMVIVNWLIFAAILIVVAVRGHHKQCWKGWSRRALDGWGVMVRLGLGGISAVSSILSINTVQQPGIMHWCTI